MSDSIWFDLDFPIDPQADVPLDLDFKNEDPAPQQVGLLLPAIQQVPEARKTAESRQFEDYDFERSIPFGDFDGF